MERARLKNLIILILVLVNGFLLTSLLLRQRVRQASHQRAVEELVQLFSEDGIALSADKVPRNLPPAVRRLSRSTQEDQALAAALLGDSLTVSDAGGGIYLYTAENGQASFRANGVFDISGSLGDDADAVCRSFCRDYGYQGLTFSLADGSGTAVASQYCDGYPVTNCTVTFRIENGRLISAEGTHLPASYTDIDTAPMTAVTALSRFLSARRESGAVVSAVNRVYLCYQLQSTAAEPMSLVPVWCIVTDTAYYYVNCSAGTVAHSGT